MEGNVLFAFMLTLLAGLSTGIGGLIAFFVRKHQPTFLSFGLGFSAGVMIYISFVELLEEAHEGLVEAWGETLGPWGAVGAFFLGILSTAIIDALVPEPENPHEVPSQEELEGVQEEGVYPAQASRRLMRMGLFTALAIALHNFPEGMATFFAALRDPALGVSIAVAIAIHNIPEGISVAVPIYYATGSRGKALGYAFLSGMAEPVGALIGYWILAPFLSDALFGFLFGLIAGIMVYISFDELLPTAREYGRGHTAITGLILGMAVMAVSLLLL